MSPTPRRVVSTPGGSFGLGWRPDLPDMRDQVVAPPTEALVELITSTTHLDLSASPFMPPVWNQGQLGSCTAHSVGCAYEFAAHASGAPQVGTPSRLFIYYGERLIEGSVSEDAGAEIRDGFKVLASGVPPETDWPYDISKFAQAPPALADTDAKAHLTTVYQRVPQTALGVKAILLGSALGAGRPVSFGFTVYSSFESEVVASTGVVPMPRTHESVLGGHAVAIVGWDDLYEFPNGDGEGAWIVRNSWDVTWGRAGYCLMPYRYLLNKRLANDFWTANVAA